MSTSSSDTVFGLGSTAIVIRPGATLAVYVNPEAGQNSTLFKYGNGGTLWLIGCAGQATLSAADLATNHTAHYLVTAGEVLSFDGPVTCYLAATAATTTVYKVIGKTAGY